MAKPKAKPNAGKHWDAKDHAWAYDTKQPGTVWDAKDHEWEDRPGGDKTPAKKGPSALGRRIAKKKGKVPPQFMKGSNNG